MINDIQRYRTLLESVAAGPNADVMSQYLSVSAKSSLRSTVFVLKIPVNQKLVADNGAKIEIYEIETAARFPHKIENGMAPFYDTIFVNCDVETPEFDDIEGDDAYDYRDETEEWLAQNSKKYITPILINAGFSPAAANSIELDAVYTDIIEYTSKAIGRELLQVASTLLDTDIHNTLKKFGVPILAVYDDYTADELIDYKTDIVRYLLQEYKTHGATPELLQILDNLDDNEVFWPELTAIRRSIRAG
jgi:hypothetical protein